MSYAIDDLVTPVTDDEALATLLAIAASVGLPTTSWQSGQPLLTLLTIVANKIAELSQIAAEITKGGFGDLLPSDSWADLWAQSRFDVQRVASTQATGTVDAANASLTNYTLAAGELIVAHAVTGKIYRNTQAIVILATVGLVDIAIAADEPGSASNAAPSTVTTVVSTLVGVTVSNPLSVLGTDKETTPVLVARARAKLAALSPNGPKDAYNYVVTTPEFTPSLTTPITRTRTVTSETTGAVTVYAATAAGAPIAGDIVIAQTAVDDWAEPWGAVATVVAATPVTVPVTYQAWVLGSQLTELQLTTTIAGALAAWFATLDLGGYVIPPDTGAIYVSALEQVIGQSTPGILRVVVSIPAADLVMTPNQVAVLGTITPTISVL